MRLRSCPYCGNSDPDKLMLVLMRKSPDRYQAFCFDCTAQGSLEKTEENALATWNHVADFVDGNILNTGTNWEENYE